MFCEVERAYIEDGFNLYGLRACVSNFSDCLDLILDRIGPDDSDDSHLTQSACTLYGLIHARYIVTAHGLDSMYNKVSATETESCTPCPLPAQRSGPLFFHFSTQPRSSAPAPSSNAPPIPSSPWVCAMKLALTPSRHSVPNVNVPISRPPSERDPLDTSKEAGRSMAPPLALPFPICFY